MFQQQLSKLVLPLRKNILWIWFKKEKNLLFIENEAKVIYYKIHEQPTNEENFLIFMEEAINTIKNKEIGTCIIIMDNLSVHKTQKLLKFYDDNKINILYNSPY